jgi:hypothetical protein
MGVQFSHEDLMEDLAGICEATPERRKVLIEVFLARNQSWHESLARRLARYPGLDANSEAVLDDLTALVMETHSNMLTALGQGPFSKPSVAWEAQLWTRSRSAIRDYAESSAVSGIAGYTTVNRRRRGLYTTAQRMEMAAGHPVSNAEVVEEYNKVASKRANPTKQAAIATEEDFIGISLSPHDPDSFPEYSRPATEDDLVTTSAAADLVKRIIEVCHETDPRWGRIAEISLEWFPDGEMLSQAEISRRTGIPSSTVKTCTEHIHEVMVEQAIAAGLVSESQAS